MECPARKVTLAHVELPDQLVQREPRDLKEQLVPQDRKAQLARKVQPGQQAPVAPASKCSQQLLQTQLHIAELANGRSGSLRDQTVFHPDRMSAAS